ncbi:hypothetical protein ABIA39_006572 [Nocardia sp. GAS34]|uniref:cutinase family protein n=1 Tax=unclassified Nocardia TaxID=2637762 RepID=UPI003D1E27AE
MPPITHCPALYVLDAQGTGESSVDADPTADTGMLGPMNSSLLAQAPPGSVQRAYVRYAAAFGGLPLTGGTGNLPYQRSESDAVAQLDASAAQVHQQCPNTMTAAVGYSQGADAVHTFAQQIGSGHGPIPADKVGGVIMFANPARTPGEPLFPGNPHRASPAPAPGTDGNAVTHVVIDQAAPAGGGLVDHDQSYGALDDGRVADFCLPGDWTCDAPQHAQLLRVAAGVAVRTQFSDPVTAITSATQALTQTVDTARATVITDDLQLGPGGRVDYLPHASLSKRLADAAGLQNSPPTVEQSQDADRKLNSVVAAVAADPIGNIPRLAQQFAQAVSANLADNQDLLNPTVLADAVGAPTRHRGYGAAAPGQQSPISAGAQWFSAMARDLTPRH